MAEHSEAAYLSLAQLVTLREAADRLRVSVRTLEREAADGRLAIVRIRSRRLVEPAELERYIAVQKESPCPSAARAPDGKFASVQALADALSSAYLPAQPATTRRRSKLRSAAASSNLRLVEPTTR